MSPTRRTTIGLQRLAAVSAILCSAACQSPRPAETTTQPAASPAIPRRLAEAPSDVVRMALPVIYLKKTGTPGVCGVTVTPTSTRRQHFIRWEVVNGCDDDPTKTHDLELRDFRLFGSERPEKARLDSDGESVPIPALCRMNGEKTVLGCFVLQNASTGWYRFRVMIDKKLADDPEMEIQN